MRRLQIAILGLSLLSAVRAAAAPIPKGTVEIRPVLGATANLDAMRRQESQFQIGVDWAYSLTGPLSLVLGAWVGFWQGYVGLEAHAGVKYRLLWLSRKVAPFFTAGLGFTAGFYPPTLQVCPPTLAECTASQRVPLPGSSDALTGLGVRLGGGLDYFVTSRVLAGVQLVADLGARFSPGEGFLGSLQVVVGVGYVW